MNIEIIIAEIAEKSTGMTCFEASKYIIDKINDCQTIRGVMIIDNIPVKFIFSPYFMDGDIFTTNQEHRLIVKYLIPIYVYNNIDKFKKVYNTSA